MVIWHTNTVLGLDYPVRTYCSFVFAATICSYNFHWWLTPVTNEHSHRLIWGGRHRNLQLALGLLGLAGAAWFVWSLRMHWMALGVSVVLTFLYTAPKLPHKPFLFLRKIAIAKTLFLALVWTYVTSVMPIWIARHPMDANAWIFLLHRFFFTYASCILFDERDLESDKREGIRSLITFLPEHTRRNLYYACLIVAAGCAAMLYPFAPAILVCIMIVPVLLLAALTGTARHNHSDYLYYFGLDGLVMLAPVLHLLWLWL